VLGSATPRARRVHRRCSHPLRAPPPRRFRPSRGQPLPALRGTSSSSRPTPASTLPFSGVGRISSHAERSRDAEEDRAERDVPLARPRRDRGRLGLPVGRSLAAAQGVDSGARLAGAGPRSGRQPPAEPPCPQVGVGAARRQVPRLDRERSAARVCRRRPAERGDERYGIRPARAAPSPGDVLLGGRSGRRAGPSRRPVAGCLLYVDLADEHLPG